jgi:NagD protein
MEKNELKKIKLFVLDMDGTIYLGEKILPGAIEFVKTARESGRKCCCK